MFKISELKAKTLVELQETAKSIGLSKTSKLKKRRPRVSNSGYTSHKIFSSR